MVAAMMLIIDKSYKTISLRVLLESVIVLTKGLRPIRSIRTHGMKEATKNHVCRKPDMRADMCPEKPMLFSNKVLE